MLNNPDIAWPDDVIARYLTVGGAALGREDLVVDVVDNGEDSYWRYNTACAGCPRADMHSDLDGAHRWAQSHAEKCRALPRPAVTQ